MCAHCQRRHAEGTEVDWDLADRLGRVSVDHRLRSAKRLDGLHSAYLVIHELKREKSNISKRFRRSNDAIGADRQKLDGKSAGSQLVQRFNDAGMLDSAGENPSRWIAGHAEQRKVVRLSGAAGEDHFRRL